MPLTLRRWRESDAKFVAALRNRKDLNRWFRQERDLTAGEQKRFIRHYPEYRAYILLDSGIPVGVVANNQSELCIVAESHYHAEAIRLLRKAEHPDYLYGEVFVSNPNLLTYLQNGFKAVAVEEAKYHKKWYGWQDIIKIESYV